MKFTERGEVRLECRVQGPFLETRRCATPGSESDPSTWTDCSSRFSRSTPGWTGVTREPVGLSICANLARLLGGDIRARSEYGVGSAFTFTVPLEE